MHYGQYRPHKQPIRSIQCCRSPGYSLRADQDACSPLYVELLILHTSPLSIRASLRESGGRGSRHWLVESPSHVTRSVCYVGIRGVCVCVWWWRRRRAGLLRDGLAMRCLLPTANANVIRVIITILAASQEGRHYSGTLVTHVTMVTSVTTQAVSVEKKEPEIRGQRAALGLEGLWD